MNAEGGHLASAQANTNSPMPMLCEECGYVIEGQPRGSVCPECSTPVEASCPETRCGSPWQVGVGPGMARWWRCLLALVRGPGTMFRRAKIERTRSQRLAEINVVVAAVILDIGIVSSMPSHLLMQPLIWVIGFMASAGLLMVLMIIEGQGLMFFSRRRGWRVTPRVARVVVAHASYGWIVAGVIFLVSVWARNELVRSAPAREIAAWLRTNAGINLDRDGVWWVGLAAIIGGIVVFESLVYIGVRRCRFANVPAATEAAKTDGV